MFGKRSFRNILIALVLWGAVSASFNSGVSASANGGNPKCDQVSLPVTLSSTNPTVYHVAGWLCAKGNLEGKTIQIVVHGLTYDHQYWNWPQSPKTYSYVHSATDDGYATFAIDRLGSGTSDHPVDGLSLTAESGAYVLHQIVQALRAGSLGDTAFSKVIAVGHSYGSVTAAYEAATYRDVDAVILSGMLHDPSPTAFVALSNFYPAFLDSKFANSGLNATYLTTIPGTRTQLFFNAATADPAVIARDEILKQTATAGELSTLTSANTLTPQINVPVLLAMGNADYLFCAPLILSCADSNAVLARESSHYSPYTCLEAVVQPTTGHDLNLHPNAHIWYDFAGDWADRRIGRDANHPATQPCL